MGEHSERDVYDDITDALAANGSMSSKEQQRLMLMALRDIGRKMDVLTMVERDVSEVKQRLSRVEAENIVRWCKGHPKEFATILTTATVFMALLLQHMGLGKWLLGLVGVPLP